MARLDEALKIKKEIKMAFPESNWNNFLLLDLQRWLFRLLKKFIAKINNHLNRLSERLFCIFLKKEYKVSLYDQVKMGHVVIWSFFLEADIWTGKMWHIGFAGI